MAVSKCPSLSRNLFPPEIPVGTDLSFREPIAGTPAFPIAVYDDNVKRDAVVWHWHEEFEIGCVTEGIIFVEIGNQKYLLHRGDVFFINSEVMHAMQNAKPGAPAVFKALVFHGSIVGGSENSVFHRKYVSPIMKNIRLRGTIFRKEDVDTDHIFSEMMKLWLAVCNEEEGYELTVRNGLSAFFQRLVTSATDSTLPRSDDEQRLEGRAKLMLDYIHYHYCETVTLKKIADAASISVSEALRCFKSIIGISPIQYLKQYRIQQAAACLKSGNYTIREVCDCCGFSDSSYFSKSFKEVYHCTPRSYRQQT